MIYPDVGYVLSLLLQGDQSEEAGKILREILHPLLLSQMHQLQVENGLVRALLGSNPEEAEAARDALRLWREYIDEEVFLIERFNLDFAVEQAGAWNAAFRFQPPRWGLLLHPAIALERKSVFLSLHPTLRQCAKKAGLKLLPEKL